MKKITNQYDKVNPEHYKNYSVEVIDMMIAVYGLAKVAVFCELSAFKYRMRMGIKPGNDFQTELQKEQWFLNKAKELRKKKDYE